MLNYFSNRWNQTSFLEHEPPLSNCNGAFSAWSFYGPNGGATIAATALPMWKACALDSQCICPPGSSKGNHRQDQVSQGTTWGSNVASRPLYIHHRLHLLRHHRPHPLPLTIHPERADLDPRQPRGAVRRKVGGGSWHQEARRTRGGVSQTRPAVPGNVHRRVSTRAACAGLWNLRSRPKRQNLTQRVGHGTQQTPSHSS